TLRLKPVEVVSKVDQGIWTGVVEQLRQAGRIPTVLRWTRCKEANVLLGTQTNQRLPKGIPAVQQHKAHSHKVSWLSLRNQLKKTGENRPQTSHVADFLPTGTRLVGARPAREGAASVCLIPRVAPFAGKPRSN